MEYDEKSTKLILAKAIELQQADSGKVKAKGTNKEELMAIAKELGIGETYLEQALALAPDEKSGMAQRWFGAPIKLHITRRTSTKADEVKLKTLALTLGSLTNLSGTGGAIGGILEWNSDAVYTQTSGSRFSVSVRSGEEGSIAEVTVSMGGLAGGIFGGLMGGLGLGAGLSLGLSLPLEGVVSGPIGVLIGLGTILGSYLLSRFIYTLVADMQKKKAEKICEKVITALDN